MTSRIKRRQAIKLAAATGVAALAAPTILIPKSWAEGKSIFVGIYFAQQGEYVRKHVVPKFEADYKCKVYTTEGFTLTQIAALRATRTNPKYSAMFMDDIGVDLAKGEGLIDPLPVDKMPNLSRLYKRFMFSDGYGAAFAISAAGMAYNPTSGVTIKSYADLWEPRFKDRILMVTPKFTQSIYLLVVAASLATGKPWAEAQFDLNAAWDRMKALKPNIQTIYEAPATVMMVAQGQADLAGIEYSKQVYPYTVSGAPISMTFPKEGTFAGVNCLTLPKNAPEPELGAAFLNRMLDPEVQQGMAAATLTAASIGGLNFAPDIAKYIAYPEAKMDEMRMFTCDWSKINPIRPGLVEKYNQIFGA
ncbi:MAG TPA: extracellular solute-binding protein [Rhodopila sp.]|uniref:extracellular solute-binding protein n=1 Tax=Rhodopila sp. TaxID=2480087 RepID=UPI002B5B209C|nr:extracellular solute-binding protein [Rhodopila sp.]HVY17706.1 extracellular solute-binding protein [Rhodopila sp.]